MKPAVMRTLLSLAVATALAGCSLAPTYERPQAPVDAAYPSGPAYGAPGQAAAGAPAAADVGWRDFFGDPLLQELLALSLANNRDLRVAALNVEAARAQYRIQRADLAPSVGVGGTGSVQRTPADLNPSGQAGISRSYQVGASLSTWELDLFGRIRSLSEQALQLYLAQDETRLATQLTLVAETANAYLTLRADQELLALTRQTLAAQQESYKLTRQSYDLGVATELDLSQAEISLRTAERNLSQYTRMAAQDRNALVLLVGQPLPAGIGAQLDQAVALPDGVVLADLPAGLPSDLLARRPDIRAAEHQLQAANASIGAARAAFFPRISLTGSAGTASASLGGLFDAGSGAWSFAPQISVPIFAGGALRASLDLAKIQKDIGIARYEQAIQSGFREVSDALAGRGTLQEQIRSQELLVQANQRAYDLSQQRYQQGIDNYLSVLDSQRSLYTAQQTLVETRLARLSNLIQLYKALGGGWSERTVAAAQAS
ncbi:AdeC/AdeK/OprM family multidrug efflux complex outer membrane factor [Bordetella bronchiseptica]|uniref:Probable outer membrane lipoprotein n=4 Tax=Bordetella bronchiseptica TaxID=518 RepID=A0A0H3LNJ3_BORBR|nr:AdeC/AdeK/OprM family multidrug efflux complex outer membrane factor [Bordetella bronchiseptica]KAK64832.1 outer membrane efflux protein OprM [Bordetella bronchiseptica 980-2]AMG88784.1 AdeC/AdeK/OprM family multidrug efflux complex outer membrane factor [Bordetella bronchiseptica]KDB84442.1 outer membrane efflux protein OprM [Bordetella bronchiseptica D756]KDB85696.1 outer membrane efflux protein OprM [Bordetella bronchiseptica D989]KDC48107.1 outer membrane efflux protein OprM [Bordetella